MRRAGGGQPRGARAHGRRRRHHAADRTGRTRRAARRRAPCARRCGRAAAGRGRRRHELVGSARHARARRGAPRARHRADRRARLGSRREGGDRHIDDHDRHGRRRGARAGRAGAPRARRAARSRPHGPLLACDEGPQQRRRRDGLHRHRRGADRRQALRARPGRDGRRDERVDRPQLSYRLELPRARADPKVRDRLRARAPREGRRDRGRSRRGARRDRAGDGSRQASRGGGPRRGRRRRGQHRDRSALGAAERRHSLEQGQRRMSATDAVADVLVAPAVETRKLRRVVFGTSAGTIFEAYDFILFGSLAPLIARQFFSGVNETAAFIFALLTFAAGFAVRPLGALVFGRIGDRTGRKKAFLITITMMGLATFGIGVLPTYATAGILAPMLLIALRIVQGLAYGGEYGGAVVYTAEHAPQHRRGLYVGWIQTAAGFALFMSFLVIYLTRTLVGEDAFEAWGWRIPFLISIGLLVISLWIRLTLEESPMFRRMVEEGRQSKAPLREAFLEWRHLKLVLIVLFALMAVQGVLFYTAHFYSQFFLIQILRVEDSVVTFVMMVVTAVSVFLYLLFSWLSDRIGRKPVILAGGILSVATAFPMFHALTDAANPAFAAARDSAPVTVVADPAECSVQ